MVSLSNHEGRHSLGPSSFDILSSLKARDEVYCNHSV
jgi:hypothetical protein